MCSVWRIPQIQKRAALEKDKIGPKAKLSKTVQATASRPAGRPPSQPGPGAARLESRAQSGPDFFFWFRAPEQTLQTPVVAKVLQKLIQTSIPRKKNNGSQGRTGQENRKSQLASYTATQSGSQPAAPAAQPAGRPASQPELRAARHGSCAQNGQKCLWCRAPERMLLIPFGPIVSQRRADRRKTNS